LRDDGRDALVPYFGRSAAGRRVRHDQTFDSPGRERSERLSDHTADRNTADRRAGDTGRVEHAHRVPGEAFDRVVGSATEFSTFDAEVAGRVTAALRKNEALLTGLISAGQADGSISRKVDRRATARLMLCVLQGMRIIGKTGRTRAEMSELVGVAMKLLD